MHKRFEREDLVIDPADSPTGWTIRIGSDIGKPTDERTARGDMLKALRAGHRDVALMLRETPWSPFVEVPVSDRERLAMSLVSTGLARPTSTYRGRH